MVNPVEMGMSDLAAAIHRIRAIPGYKPYFEAAFGEVDGITMDNEAKAIRATGGVIWEVRRVGAGIPGNHSSEAGISDHLIDLRIENDGTVGSLAATVYTALDCLHNATMNVLP